MATSTAQIAGYLERRSLKFIREDDKNRVTVPFTLENSDRIIVVIGLEENGEFLKIICPNLLRYLDGPHKLPLMQSLLMVSWETKMLQWEYDPGDGEVRAIIEFPIEDSLLTERQFFRAFTGLVTLIQTYLPRLKAVAETGKDPGREGHDTPTDRWIEELRRHLDERERGGSQPPPDAI